MKLKVCGLSNKYEIETCVDSDVDFCGFILNYPKSHRYVDIEKAKRLLDIDKKKTKFVGVLVSPNFNELEKFSKLNLDYFQLYGDFTNEALSKLKLNFQKKIITSIQVKKKSDIDYYKDIEDSSDIILWDSAGYEKSLSWNYNWIKEIKIKGEKMVAGNIDKKNLYALSGLTDIIDVSGSLETNKVKDIKKIKEFANLVKNKL